MAINVYPLASTGATANTGWTAGVAGTFTLSSSLAAGTYLVKTDTTQTMTISFQDAAGHTFSGTVRGGSGFISVPVTVTKIIIPGSLTYPFGIEIVPISVTQVAAPTSGALSLGVGGIMTGTWSTVPSDAVSAHLLTTTGDILNFSSTASGATVTVSESNTTPNAVNNFIIAFKNSSGAWGIGATVPYTMPASPYPFNVEYFVVGAGGSAGGSVSRSGGGGGAVKTGTLANTSLSSFTLTVAGTTPVNASGGTTTFAYGSTTITATGGAGGVSGSSNGANGSSGSGGRSEGSSTVFSGGTGSDGGNGGASVSANTTYASEGAGGGAGGSASGWNSGNGIASSITGVSVGYAGGGAGGQYSTAGSVGLGGTGRGGSGAANSGAGAGSGGNFGGGDKLGGSGVVIYAYPSTAPALTTIPGTLTYSVSTTSRTGYRVYTFTAGNGTVTI